MCILTVCQSRMRMYAVCHLFILKRNLSTQLWNRLWWFFFIIFFFQSEMLTLISVFIWYAQYNVQTGSWVVVSLLFHQMHSSWAKQIKVIKKVHNSLAGQWAVQICKVYLVHYGRHENEKIPRKGIWQRQKVRAHGRRLSRKRRLENVFCLKKANLVMSVMT